MNKIKISAAMLAFFSFIQIGLAQNCSGTASAILDINNAKVKFDIQGTFINTFGTPPYVFPYAEGGLPEVNGIYGMSIWVSGKDANGDLKISAPTYAVGGAPGALDENGELFDEDTCTNWDRMFKVSKESINSHKADFEDNGVINNQIPADVLLWPGSGNPNFFDAYGFDLENYFYGLAPFHDVNGDAIYNPQDGDYPDVNDADMAIWWMMNDVGNYSEDAIGIVTQFLAYAYSINNQIGNTTFVNAKMIYLDQEPLSDARVSLWIDADLGCYSDDYVGSIPSHNLGYIYNADPVDGDNGCQCVEDIPTYCETPPTIAFKLLDGIYNPATMQDMDMSSFMIYNNGNIGNPQQGTTDPNSPEEYLNYMSGKWSDGTPLTFGGTGYNLGSSDFTDFAFSGGDWTMCGGQLNSSDPRMLINNGPYELQPGAVDEFVFAIIGIPEYINPCLSDMTPLTYASNYVCTFYENEVVGTKQQYLPNNTIAVFPNPMTASTTFDFGALSGKIQNVELFSVDGKLVRNYSQVNESLTISRNELNEGMYFYKVHTKNQKLISGKLMVQ